MKWRPLMIFCFMFFILGFNTYSRKNLWETSTNSTASKKLFIIYPHADLIIGNDLQEGDPLAGVEDLTLAQVMQSIIDDFNNIEGAYLILASNDDVDYNEENGTFHTITINFDGADGTNGGQAKYIFKDQHIRGCRIDGEPDLLKSAKHLIRTITHEMGHCVGLDHPQDTVNAIMSYFSSDDLRLQLDDKMGIIYLFPENSNEVKEKYTYGLSCQKR